MIKSLVTRICSALYAATNSQRDSQTYDAQTVVRVLSTANRLGLTSHVIDWYEKSSQYNRSLSTTLNSCFPDDEQVNNLLSVGESYWSSYGLSSGSQPTPQDLHAHQYCYRLAEQASGVVSDTQQIQACVYQAVAKCMYDQFKTVCDTFFSGVLDISPYESLASAAKQTMSCETTTVTYVAPANKTAGDEKDSGSDAVPTLSTGSARQSTPRDTYTRVSEPFVNHLVNTSTLHTRMMMSDLSENMVDVYDHVRLSNTFDKTQTSSEYLTDMSTIFQSESAIMHDNTIDAATNIKLQNRFLYNQIGDRSLVADNGNVASTRTQTLSAS